MRKLLLIVLALCAGCNRKTVESAEKIQVGQQTADTLERELQLLKNQAFCDCYRVALRDEPNKPSDGSNYMQLSGLDIAYFNDPNLKRLVKKWNAKEYASHEPSNKLYLMRCLDFYNSTDLQHYLDSVRKVEVRKKP
jgi:hypothetical protein